MLECWFVWFAFAGNILLHTRACINSLAPGRFERNFSLIIFKLISVTDGWGISCKIALRWMPLDLTHDKSTLFQVMAWCRQATSHYLSQCWPRFMSPFGVTRPQWVNCFVLTKCSCTVVIVLVWCLFFWLSIPWLGFSWASLAVTLLTCSVILLSLSSFRAESNNCYRFFSLGLKAITA